MLKLTAILVAAFAAMLPVGGDAAESEDMEVRFEQLELEVTKLRAENRLQRLRLDSLSHQDAGSPLAMTPASEFIAPTVYQEKPESLGVSSDLTQLADDVSQTKFTVQRLESKLDQLEGNLSISLLDKEWSATITGAMIGEMIFAEQRPITPSGIVLISPHYGRDTPTVDVHGKSSKIGILFRGPDLMGLQTGGAMLTYFFGENFLADAAGINLIGGYAELKNEHWRFLFGRAGDLMNPRRPGMLDINGGRNAGNIGFTRGQFRVERYLHPTRNTQITTLLSLSNPIATAYNAELNDLLEDNGWPNVEGRVVFGAGPVTKKYGYETRQFEVGASGMIGEVRKISLTSPRVFQMWGLGLDAKADLSKRYAVRAEFFCGQGLGNLNGGILQVFNPITLEEVRTLGGWSDFRINWTERLRSAIGFGVDNPLNSTVPPGKPTRNAFVFGNLVWDITPYAEIGFEIAQWDTDYAPSPAPVGPTPRDNKAMIYRTRVVLRF